MEDMPEEEVHHGMSCPVLIHPCWGVLLGILVIRWAWPRKEQEGKKGIHEPQHYKCVRVLFVKRRRSGGRSGDSESGLSQPANQLQHHRPLFLVLLPLVRSFVRLLLYIIGAKWVKKQQKERSARTRRLVLKFHRCANSTNKTRNEGTGRGQARPGFDEVGGRTEAINIIPQVLVVVGGGGGHGMIALNDKNAKGCKGG